MEKITVAICTYNRSYLLKKVLESLVNQTVKKDFFEVLVVDNNSSDNTREVVKIFESLLSLKYVFENKQGLSYARNRAIKNCQTEYISFIDDDSIAENNWLEIAYDLIKNGQYDIFGGSIYPYYIDKKIWFLDKYEIREPAVVSSFLHNNQFLSGSNIFFRRSIFIKIGNFDQKLGMKGNKIGVGEETLLQICADKKEIKRYFSSKLIVYTLVPIKKMELKYLIKRTFITGYVSKQVFISKRGLFVDGVRFFMSILLIIFSSITMIFRNRKKYRYWQNYFVEKICNYFYVIGVFFSYFRLIKF
ncbi:MAG: glycosyltransferase [Candidatus Magasanikbacteria bacterium]